MKQVNGKIIFDEEEFLVNSLFVGSAIKALSVASGRDISTWIKIFIESANVKLNAMTIEEKQAMINTFIEYWNDEER